MPPVDTHADHAADVAAPSPRRPQRFGRYGEVLSIRTFRLFWTSQLLGSMGSSIAEVALPLLVYELTGSAKLLSLLFVIQVLPRILLAPIIGIIADRFDRRRVLLVADLSRAVLVSFIPFFHSTLPIAILAGLISIGTAVAHPTESAATPTTVPNDMLVPALSLVQVSRQFMRVLGPALGAALIGTVGPGPTMWVQTVCYGGSFVMMLRVMLPPNAPEGDAARPTFASSRADMIEGFKVVLHTPIVRGITATECLWQLIGAVMVIAGVILTHQTLDLGDRSGLVYGLLMASLSSGAVIGALLASRMESVLGRPKLMLIGYLGPLMFVPIGLGLPLPGIFLCWFGLGFTDAWAVIGMQSYLAEAVDSNLRGRVFATWGAVLTIGSLIGYPLLGWITPILGAPMTFTVIGLTVGLGGPLLLVVTGAMRDVLGSRLAAPSAE